MKMPKACIPELREELQNFRRQALHAKRLELSHPISGEFMEWEVDLPDDMKQLIELLNQDLAETDSVEGDF
jgi:23S rRNA pseudouridine1911/1915/1917 synthase